MISIVIPIYNSSQTIKLLVDKLISTLTKEEIQIVLVNDGSADNSHKICRKFVQQYPAKITYLQLSKNFGEHNAVMAGLNHARGEYAVIMDDDFQNPPREVQTLVDAAKDGNYDVVYTFYKEKKHSMYRNLGSRLHNWMATYLLHKPKDLYLSSFKCINRFAIDQVVKYKGPYPYLDGLLLRCTHNIGKVQVTHNKRNEGKSGYTLTKLVRLWLNMFLNFSILPLRVGSVIGCFISLCGMIMAVIVVLEKIAEPNLPIGWSSTIVIVTTFSGFQIFILGLIGEYLGTMFLGFNRAPQYVVREVIEC